MLQHLGDIEERLQVARRSVCAFMRHHWSSGAVSLREVRQKCWSEYCSPREDVSNALSQGSRAEMRTLPIWRAFGSWPTVQARADRRERGELGVSAPAFWGAVGGVQKSVTARGEALKLHERVCRDSLLCKP